MPAAVLDVAVLAGIGVKQRAQTIACRSGRRRDDPRVAEEAVANAEIQAPHRWQIRRWQGEGVLVELHDRRAAGRQGFAGFGVLEAWCVVTAKQAERQKCDGGYTKGKAHWRYLGWKKQGAILSVWVTQNKRDLHLERRRVTR